jgi:predicted phosphodiesterase
MSFAKKVKASVKEAVKFIGDFETTAVELAARQGYDYVICGHIHQPQMKSVTQEGRRITYMNSGDWVESLTALEYQWGSWSIYEYDESHYQRDNAKSGSEAAEKNEEFDEDTLREKKLSLDSFFRLGE